MEDSPEAPNTPAQSPEEVGARHQEKTTPEQNKSKSLDSLFYFIGSITRKSLADKKTGIERSRQLRRTRAKLYKKFKRAPAENQVSTDIFREAKLRDALEVQFLNQGEVTVDIPSLGPQTSRYTTVDLPESQKPKEAVDKPPIVFIPGISNDLVYGIGLVEELALSGRKVISIGYPESTLGKVTPEFAKACQASQTYEPHTTFFKEAISRLVGKDTPIELWGHSTGSAIIGDLLKDPQFSQKVTTAVLLCPASSFEQSDLSLNIGTASELRDLIGNLPEYSRFDYTPQGQSDLKKEVYNTMRKKVCTKLDYTTSRVQEGGKIVVVSGAKDNIVKSRLARQDFERNPQITFINWPGAYHATPMIKPEATIDMVNTTLQNANKP